MLKALELFNKQLESTRRAGQIGHSIKLNRQDAEATAKYRADTELIREGSKKLYEQSKLR